MSFKVSKDYRISANELFGFSKSALKGLGANIEASDVNIGQIHASTGMTCAENGKTLFIYIDPITSTESRITLEIKMKFQIDWGGFRRRAAEQFFSFLDSIVARTDRLKQ